MFQITFEPATITHCDFIGRGRFGICAVVLKDGVEVFRTAASAKRINPKLEAQQFITEQGA